MELHPLLILLRFVTFLLDNSQRVRVQRIYHTGLSALHSTRWNTFVLIEEIVFSAIVDSGEDGKVGGGGEEGREEMDKFGGGFVRMDTEISTEALLWSIDTQQPPRHSDNIILKSSEKPVDVIGERVCANDVKRTYGALRIVGL